MYFTDAIPVILDLGKTCIPEGPKEDKSWAEVIHDAEKVTAPLPDWRLGPWPVIFLDGPLGSPVLDQTDMVTSINHRGV